MGGSALLGWPSFFQFGQDVLQPVVLQGGQKRPVAWDGEVMMMALVRLDTLAFHPGIPSPSCWILSIGSPFWIVSFGWRCYGIRMVALLIWQLYQMLYSSVATPLARSEVDVPADWLTMA